MVVYAIRRLRSESPLGRWTFAFTRLLTATNAKSRLTPLFGFPHRGCFGNKLRPVLVFPLSRSFFFGHHWVAYHCCGLAVDPGREARCRLDLTGNSLGFLNYLVKLSFQSSDEGFAGDGLF